MNRSLRGALVVASALGLVTEHLHAQTIEPGVRPGGQRMEERPALPAAAPVDLINIPPVVERPLDEAEGPTVRVTRFELVGPEAVPEQKIARAEVEKIAADAIAARGGVFTVGQLQAVADAITNYYRERGFVLATAIIPVQDVQEGVVRLELLVGLLGEVKVEGNKRYSTAALQRPFQKLQGIPVEQNRLESALLRLNDYPGLAVTGVMKPGKEVGQGDLVASVQKERWYELNLGTDNYGRKETGDGRFRAQGILNNPLGIGDQFTAFFQPSIAPANQKFVSGDYMLPLGNLTGHEVRMFYRYNDFDVDDENPTTEIDGVTDEGGVELAHRWLRGRTLNVTTYEGFTRKQADTFVDGDKVFRDILAVVNFRIEADYTDRRFAGINGATLEYRRGVPGIAGAMSGSTSRTIAVTPSRRADPPPNQPFSARIATGKFDSFLGSIYRLQSLAPLNPALAEHAVLVRFEGQWSDDLLVPLEQFAVGGIQNVRGYQPSEALFDRGIYGTIEYQMPPPFIGDKEAFLGKTWGELFALSAFYDYAWGRLNSPVAGAEDPSSGAYRAAGFAVQMTHGTTFNSRLTVASALNDEGVRRNPRIWFEFNYSF